MIDASLIDRNCAFRLAGEALATGEPASCPTCGLAAVPDVILVQGAANGEAIPDTWKLLRADCRTVALYRLRKPEVGL